MPYGPDDILTLSQVAEKLAVDARTVIKTASALGGKRVGRSWRFRYGNVMEFFNAGVSQGQAQYLPAGARDPGRETDDYPTLFPGPKTAPERKSAREPEIQSAPAGLGKLLAWRDAYLDHVERTMSRSTYQEKKSHMAAFLTFCRTEGIQTPEAVTKPKAYKFLAAVRNAKEEEARERRAAAMAEKPGPQKPRKGGKIGTPESVTNKYRKNILAAWNWGVEYVENFPQTRSPFAMVKEFAVEPGERYIPPEEDVIKVLEVATGQDLVMLLVFYYTGAHAGEVFRLSWQRDLRLEEGKIRLEGSKTRGWTKRVRWHDMHPELVKALAWWREARPCTVDNVFMQTHSNVALGRPFRHRSKLCARLCGRAGVKPFVFYAIRHVSGHISFKEGGVSAAQALLRHNHATTTDLYLRQLGLLTDQRAIQDSLAKSGIGRAASNLVGSLIAGESRQHNGPGSKYAESTP